MNKSQRIYFDTGNTDTKYVQIRLEQGTETLDLMSLNLSTKDAYQNFNADYGVLVGRVNANGAVGIPNAKISIFIPLMEEDETNGIIKSIYPYKTPRDKNNEGKRYNLLPRVSKIDPSDKTTKPKQAFGSFPIKEEILTNERFLDVYKKYYKYTTTTNDAGDYMIFGVPVGTQTVHMSVDITDIGEYSMNPAAMITNLGYSPNLFTDNRTKIKESSDLDDLPHIETQEISVDIRPFWGDTENFEIGITRQDFRVRATLKNVFYVFGSVFTDGEDSFWGHGFEAGERRIGEMFRAGNDDYDANETVGIFSKRIGKVTEKIYYYPAEVTDQFINSADPKDDMLVLDPSEYSVFKKAGAFVFIINCNRNKIITNDFGINITVPDDHPDGVFTEFRGFITLELTDDELQMTGTDKIGAETRVRGYRYKLKFPQYASAGNYFTKDDDDDNGNIQTWRKQHKIFEAGKYYSFARFHPLVANNATTSDFQDDEQFFADNSLTDEGFFRRDIVNSVRTWDAKASNNSDYDEKDPFWNVGIIVTTGTENSNYNFPANMATDHSWNDAFGANWLNLAVYLPQLGNIYDGYEHIEYVRTADHFQPQKRNSHAFNRYYLHDNTQQIAGGDYNMKNFPRNDLNWTDIIEVPLTDILNMRGYALNGFKASQFKTPLVGTYRNGSTLSSEFGWSVSSPCPYGGGVEGALKYNINKTLNDDAEPDEEIYFYKGFEGGDCIEYLFELGIISVTE